MIQTFFDPGLWLLGYDYVALNKIGNRWNYLSLAAPFWRVYWNNTGGAFIRLGRQTIPLRPSRLYVIAPNTDFSSIHHAHCRQFYIHFQIRQLYTLRGLPVINLPLTRERENLVHRIITCHRAGELRQQQTALLIHAFMDTLIADLAEKHLFFRRIDKRLMDTLNYLERHLDQPITNRQLAASISLI
jgi:hypothetical protein